jgi:hypothetical protein
MALTIPGSTSSVIGIGEFLDYVRREVDLKDPDSVAAAAPMLRALANDRELIVRQLNKQIRNQFTSDAVASAQVIFLGKGPDFYVRANVWPSLADIASGRVYQDQFSYHLAHDHNYGFMTIGYSGPGYITEIYEYDYHRLEGYVGEPVDIRFLERVHFATGTVMLYRASRDLHIQLPPDDLSITLNLMIATPEVRLRDQYFFDLKTGRLMEYPVELDGSRRVSLLRMAATNGNEDTRQLLDDLARMHPCRRTRLTAFESLARLDPANAKQVWESACKDREAFVARAGRRKLESDPAPELTG